MLIALKDAAVQFLVRRIPKAISPNHLSGARLIIAPVLILTLFKGFIFASALLFAFGMLLDLIDGPLARLRGHITERGKWLDPLADKALFGVAFLLLGYYLLPFELFYFVIILELAALIGAGVIMSFNARRATAKDISANRFGQYKMFLYSIGTLLLFSNSANVILASYIFFAAGILLGIASGVKTALDASQK